MLRIAALIAIAALSACASPSTASTEEPAARDCFRTHDVRGYGIVDDHRVRLRINSERAYILTIRDQTRNFDVTEPIAVLSSSGFVCVGQTAGVRLVGADPAFPSPVTAIERAPPREASDQGS